ncbi:uncharacterized protein LOC134777599 [Penaeus indicus]|uniref:uncharacterized protein LOC134777599 n=1 Tax=Penaeus indicus TaxID=29960 RepID=UPI00300C525E
MGPGIRWFFCLVLLAGLPTRGSTDCAPAPHIATGHVLDGLKVWTCPLGTVWSNGDRVHISNCDDDAKIDDTLSCVHVNITTLPCPTDITQQFTDIEEPVDVGTSSKYLKCQGENKWLSGRDHNFVHCEEGAWTIVSDMCDKGEGLLVFCMRATWGQVPVCISLMFCVIRLK